MINIFKSVSILFLLRCYNSSNWW